MTKLTSLGLTKTYSITSEHGDKVRVYNNPFYLKDSAEYLPFIESLKNSPYRIAPEFHTYMCNYPFIMKQGSDLSLLSSAKFTHLEVDYLNTLPDRVSIPEVVNLLNSHCNPKIQDLSSFAELEPAAGTEFRFKNDPQNPMRVRLTRSGQLSWETAHEGLQEEHIVKTLEFTLKHKRKAHVNAEPYTTENKSERIATPFLYSATSFKNAAKSSYYDSNISVHYINPFLPRLTTQHIHNIDVIETWCAEKDAAVKNLWRSPYKKIYSALTTLDNNNRRSPIIPSQSNHVEPLNIQHLTCETPPQIVPKYITRVPLLNSINDCAGREKELQYLENKFSQESAAVQINGIGGIGKTMLARAYATKFKDTFEHIIWIEGTSKGYLHDFVKGSDLASLVGIKDAKKIQPEQLKTVYHKITDTLQGFEDKPCLLVIDNAHPDFTHWTDYLPTHSNWHVIITSRISEFQPERYTQYTLDLLPEQDAIALFKLHYTDNKMSETAIKQCIEKADNHPITIELFAKTAKKFKLNEEEILPFLNNNSNLNIFLGHGYKMVKHADSLFQQEFNIQQLEPREQLLLSQIEYLSNSFHHFSSIGRLINEEVFNRQFPHYNYSEVLDDLFLKGFLLFNKSNQSYKLLKVIADAIHQQIKPNFEEYTDLVANLKNKVDLILKNPKLVRRADFITFTTNLLNDLPTQSPEYEPLIHDLQMILKKFENQTPVDTVTNLKPEKNERPENKGFFSWFNY